MKVIGSVVALLIVLGMYATIHNGSAMPRLLEH
jgi:hypothetical protein